MIRKRGTWIACVGPIGVGKSTLAAIVARRTGASFVPERFGENPFLERFYAPGGIERWGFQTEVSFLTQRVDQVNEIAQSIAEGRSVVTDFTPQQNLIFARITVDPMEFGLYRELYDRLFEGLPRPDRLICLGRFPDIGNHSTRTHPPTRRTCSPSCDRRGCADRPLRVHC